MREVARVLKPNGLLIVSFSNRVFIDKAVSIWTGKADIDHIETVGSYIYCSNSGRNPAASFQLSSIRAIDIFQAIKPVGDRTYMNGCKDPLYAVTARRNP